MTERTLSENPAPAAWMIPGTDEVASNAELDRKGPEHSAKVRAIYTEPLYRHPAPSELSMGTTTAMKMVNSRTNDPYPEGWSIDIVHLSIHRTTKTHMVGYGFEVGLEAYVQDRIRAALSAPATEADNG